MRLILIPMALASIVLAGCATGSAQGNKAGSDPSHAQKSVYTCKSKRQLGVAYEFVNDKASKVFVSDKRGTYELTRADQTDGDATAFTNGTVTWIVSGEVIRQSAHTNQGSRLLKVGRNGRAATVASDCKPR
ncbi:hypothetical protein CAP48_00935 [Advenella sp. S44]|uniref:hypothetical protein n=1 Tax=Advenella sp. S44 TaxID=1982755 RepID=UPI000C2B0929|nr:hypothetical protein [Advenella sp. S44]PJX27793.1 hypothetical protein CAP48_00935 [Advenella sp. S44]